jgi:bacterioferritin
MTRHQADRTTVIGVLGDVVATEIVCWLRYSRHASSASGIHPGHVSAEFSSHAEDELRHAVRVAERVSQLGGEPDFDPKTLTSRVQTAYETPEDGADLAGMLRENLAAERAAICTYREILHWLGDGDVVTRRLLESLLAEKEERADDLRGLLASSILLRRSRLPRPRSSSPLENSRLLESSAT